MADAAAAAHEQHGDVGNIDHGHAVMPRPARQFEHGIGFGRNRFRHLRFQPWRAGHSAVFVGDVDLQRQVAPLRDRLDAPDDIGHRKLAVRILRRANVERERHPARDHVGGARKRGNGADGADQSGTVGLAELLDRHDAFGGARQRVTPHRHRHGSGVPGHAGEVRRQPRGA